MGEQESKESKEHEQGHELSQETEHELEVGSMEDVHEQELLGIGIVFIFFASVVAALPLLAVFVSNLMKPSCYNLILRLSDSPHTRTLFQTQKPLPWYWHIGTTDGCPRVVS